MSRNPTLTPDTRMTGGFADPDEVQTHGRFTCPCGLPVIAAHSVPSPALPIWITPDPQGAWTLTDTDAARFLPGAERLTTPASERYRLHYPDCPVAVEVRKRERKRRREEAVRRRREAGGVAA